MPMSNCINSGINKVYILTQFNSASLNRHLARAYAFGNGGFGDGYLEVYDKEQRFLSILYRIEGKFLALTLYKYELL